MIIFPSDLSHPLFYSSSSSSSPHSPVSHIFSTTPPTHHSLCSISEDIYREKCGSAWRLESRFIIADAENNDDD
jgi:hypothetical protein